MASVEFQRQDGYPEKLCPHCDRVLAVHTFCCDAHPMAVPAKCPQCGEVIQAKDDWR